MIIAVAETRRKNLIYALYFAGLHEFLGLFGGCTSKAGSECNTTAALRRRHECGSTDDEGKQQVAACGKHRATVQCGAKVSARAERVQRDAKRIKGQC